MAPGSIGTILSHYTLKDTSMRMNVTVRNQRPAFRLLAALFAVLVLGVTPFLQAAHLSSSCGMAATSCCCCSDGEQQNEAVPATGMSDKCGCEMSSREPIEQAPAEAQLRLPSNASFDADETVSSFRRIPVSSFRIPLRAVTPNILGPPLYISKSSLLI